MCRILKNKLFLKQSSNRRRNDGNKQVQHPSNSCLEGTSTDSPKENDYEIVNEFRGTDIQSTHSGSADIVVMDNELYVSSVQPADELGTYITDNELYGR